MSRPDAAQPGAPATATEGGAYAAEPRAYEPASVPRVVLHDDARGKDVEIRVTYPSEAGNCPLVLLSHYSGGTKDDFPALARHLASHGYVVIQPNHWDSPQVGGQRGPLARQHVPERPGDLSFVLDSLAVVTEHLAGTTVDPGRVGGLGHYMGCITLQMTMGYALGGRTFTDDRVRCAVLLSPTGREGAATEQSYAPLVRPFIVLTGPEDVSTRTSNNPRWRTEPFEFAPPGDKYLAWREGFGGTYCGLAQTGGPAAGDGAAAAVTSLTLAFFDAFLRDDASAKQWLASGAPSRLWDVEVSTK